MENTTEKIIIELLQEIKQEQQKLNQRFDDMDRNFNFIIDTIGKLPTNLDILTIEEPEINALELDGQMTSKILKNPIHETVSFENLGELWNKALFHLSEEVSKPSFETWMKSTRLLSYDNNCSTITITAPNSFARDWLENHYSNLIKDVLMQLTGRELVIEFVVQKD